MDELFKAFFEISGNILQRKQNKQKIYRNCFAENGHIINMTFKKSLIT